MSEISARRLLATVFCSGMAVMIVEMTAVRTLQPFFGSTNIVWTNVIGVVLAALSIGYVVGGNLADRWPSARLLYGVMATGGALLIAVAWLVTPLSGCFLADGVDLEGVMTVLLQGSLGVTLLLFAPPILLLGMISPIAVRLLASDGVGKAAGRVYAISTVGSIAGTYLPAFWLVPAVGSRGSVLVAASLLLGAAALGRGGSRIRVATGMAIAIFAAALVPFVAPPGRPAPDVGEGGTARVLAEVESPYQYLTVRDDSWPGARPLRILTINEGVYTYHSLVVEGQVLTDSRYYDDYSLLPLLIDVEPGDELRTCVVGMACGVNAMQWMYFWGNVFELRIDGAEIDPEVVRLGREFFGVPGPDDDRLRVFAMDGRQMLEAMPADTGYHILVVDAFTNELYTPFHLATREFFDLCRSRLADGGVLAMNVYAVGEDAPNLRALENTLATSFGACISAKQRWGTNFLLLARKADTVPDLSRLTLRPRARFGRWPGYEAWSRKAELADLLAKGPPLAAASHRVVPSEDEWLLTDDHAPLEQLTDRFLSELESETLATGGRSGGKLKALLGKQRSLLTWIGAAWLVALLVAWVGLRRAGRRGPGRGGR